MTDSGFRRRFVDLGGARRDFIGRLLVACRHRRLVIWGAGRAGEIALGVLQQAGVPVDRVVDRDTSRQGRLLAGVPIASPDSLCREADRKPADFVLLASMHAEAMAHDLATRGWQLGVDFRPFPLASIYQPDLGFLLDSVSFAPAVASTRGAEEPHPVPVTVLASSRGNFFFRELRDFLVQGLVHSGWTAVADDENAIHVAGVPVVVGPHEFFSVGDGVAWFSRESLASAVLVSTEQPQSPWFREFAPAFAAAGAVVDITPNGNAAWHARGIASEWLPLGWFPGAVPFDRLSEHPAIRSEAHGGGRSGSLIDEDQDAWVERPIDVLFVGSHSPRREAVLDRLQRLLPELKWQIHMPSDRVPLGNDVSHIDGAGFVALARRAKVLLNIHRDDAAFWEWQRIVWRGLWQRVLVVTEPTGSPAAPLVAGEHFLEVSAADLADVLRDVFLRPDGAHRADRIRRAGCGVARDQIPFSLAAAVLARACARLEHHER